MHFFNGKIFSQSRHKAFASSIILLNHQKPTSLSLFKRTYFPHPSVFQWCHSWYHHVANGYLRDIFHLNSWGGWGKQNEGLHDAASCCNNALLWGHGEGNVHDNVGCVFICENLIRNSKSANNGSFISESSFIFIAPNYKIKLL